MLGFKSKGAKEPKCALVWRTRLSGVPPDSVRCTRTVQLWTGHLRVSTAPLHYNSPDCPVHQRSNGYQRNGRLQQTPANATVREQFAQKSEQPPEAHQTVNNTCSVPQEDKAPTVVRAQTLMVGWRGWRTGQCPVAHQTVRCAHRQQPLPTVVLVVEGYKYPPTTSTPTIQAFNTLHSIQEK
jgi:hypothetical protein